MPANASVSEREYTLVEIKEKYFPNCDWESLRPRKESIFTNESFQDALEKVSNNEKTQEQGE